MSFSGKLILCLAIALCVIQGISARPRFDENFGERVKHELQRKITGVERDINKEINKAEVKLEKESAKLIKKGTKMGKAEATECIGNAKTDSKESLNEQKTEFDECITDVKNSLEEKLIPEASLPEIMIIRSELKDMVNGCKKTYKDNVKQVLNSFSSSGKNCLA